MADSSLVCVADYEHRMLQILDRNARDYYKSGANNEQTLDDNVRDFQRLRFRPRMMVDVSNITMATEILGQRISFPVCIAPTASQRMAHPLGEIANAKAAKSAGTCYVLSTIATTSALELADALGDSLRWYQLYISKDRSITEQMVRRAENSGFTALVLTVDTPTFGNRYADTRNKFSLPSHLKMANFEGLSTTANTGMSESGGGSGLNYFSDRFFDQSVTWRDISWLKSISRLPVVVKGVVTDFDADNAVKAGCDAIIVSNHGGRQLDGVTSTIVALPEVVRTVRGRVEVYMDGGVRTGTDVLKALSLGAKAVFIGRPALYGLAVGGEEGVKNILEIFRAELKLAMQLSGVTDVNNVPKELVVHESFYSRL